MNKQPLSFKELVENKELDLSRSRVNEHLKKLEEEDLIKKEYRDGKLLNILQRSSIDYVSLFLDMLEGFGVPKEIVDKGQSLISPGALLTSASIYQDILVFLVSMNNKLSIKEQSEAILIKQNIQKYSLFCDIIPESVPVLSIEPKDGEFEFQGQRFKGMTIELNPYIFHLALIQYSIERVRKKGKVNVEGRGAPATRLSVTRHRGLFESFDNCRDWWFKEVCPYLPMSGFLSIMLEFINQQFPKRIFELEP